MIAVEMEVWMQGNGNREIAVISSASVRSNQWHDLLLWRLTVVSHSVVHIVVVSIDRCFVT